MLSNNELKRRFPPPWGNRIEYSERGHVVKTFLGNGAEERFSNELDVLHYLKKRGCYFIPKVLSAAPETLSISMENSGRKRPIKEFSYRQILSYFERLEDYGVRHDDPKWANMVFRESDGEMVLLDFEFSTLL